MSHYFNPEHSDTVHIDAKVENGKFINIHTKKEVKLKDCLLVKIEAPSSAITDDQQLYIEERKKVLDKGTKVYFSLNDVWLEFTIVLNQDLYFTKRQNKPSRAENCEMNIEACKNMLQKEKIVPFESMTVRTFNQAFYQMSEKYRMIKRSSTMNIYEHFYILENNKKKYLSELRF